MIQPNWSFLGDVVIHQTNIRRVSKSQLNSRASIPIGRLWTIASKFFIIEDHISYGPQYRLKNKSLQFNEIYVLLWIAEPTFFKLDPSLTQIAWVYSLAKIWTFKIFENRDFHDWSSPWKYFGDISQIIWFLLINFLRIHPGYNDTLPRLGTVTTWWPRSVSS